MFDVWLSAGGKSIDSYSEFLRARQRISRRNQRRFRAVMESLERRLLLSQTFLVTNLADDGRSGSLRWAVEQAMSAGGGNTIDFQNNLSGTIDMLNGPTHLGPLVFTAGTNTTINGISGVNIVGNDDSTVWEIEAGATLNLNNITTTGGNFFGPISAGDIYNDGTLNIAQGSDIIGVAQADFHATEVPTGTLEGDGGAIFNDSAGILNITGATTAISGQAELGGGIYNTGGTVNITDASITGAADTGGGILNANGGTVTINDATFTACVANISGAAICNEAGSTLTATNTTFAGGASSDWGGEITNYANAIMTLTGDTVTGGAALEGAGIFNFTGATLNAIDTTVTGNTATLYGAGIYNFEGTVNFTGGSIETNAALDGGGIYNVGGTVTLNNSTLSGNTATGIATPTYPNPSVNYSSVYGGGIDNTSEGSSTEVGTIIVENSTISTNSATTGETGGIAQGGGIYSNIGTVQVTSSTVDSNTISSSDADADGAGIYSRTDLLEISASTISNNAGTTGATGNTTPTPNIPEVHAFGGGIDSAGGDTLKMVNSTVAYNTITDTGTYGDSHGGGLWDAGNVTITNSTIADNSAVGFTFILNEPDTEAGGIYVTGSGNTTLYNTIVANNPITQGTGGGFQDIIGNLDQSLAAGQTASSNNLISTRISGNGFNIAGGLTNGVNGNIVGSDPNLDILQNNGGPTDTMALLFGSPAINAGYNGFAVDFSGHALTTDQRGTGFARIVNTTVDIGAYEFQNANGGSPGAANTASPAASTSPTSGTAPAIAGAQIVPTSIYMGNVVAPDAAPGPDNTGVPYDPQQIDAAYGVDLISFNGTAGTGAGETVAIVDAYDDADVVGDANVFSSAFNLPEFNAGAGTPNLTVYNQAGAISPGPVDATPPTAIELGWLQEEALDVEWVHAIAPLANIDVFEANSQSLSDLLATVTSAENTAGVSVISMSWGYQETAADVALDADFATPNGHTPITFIASAGDDGSPLESYPSTSPNVVAVGGTRLNINPNGTYGSESSWDGSGGGVSLYQPQPSYQTGNVNGASSTNRIGPDISADADTYTGVYEYYSYSNGTTNVTNWGQIGGTSLSAPIISGMVAIANQGRALRGAATLDGPTQTLPMLYSAPSSDFNDITQGDNGYAATSGFDLATGLGSPIAYKLVPYLAGDSAATPQLVFTTQPTTEVAGQNLNSFSVDVEDGSGNILTNFTGNIAMAVNTGPGTLSGTVTVAAVNGVATFTNLKLTETGAYTLQASSGNIPDADSSSFTVVAAAAAKLAFLQEPSGAAATATITPPVTVEVEDQFGNVVTSDSSSVSLAITQGTGVLAGTTTEAASSGIATFSNLSINVAGIYVLTASDGLLTTAASPQFVITIGVLSQLGFKVEPTTVAAGGVIAPAVEVVLEDNGSNPVAGYTEPVTLSVATGPGTLKGTLTEITQNGVATFSNLSLDTLGTYTLEATVPGNITGTSTSFTVTPGAAAELGFVNQPTNTAAGATMSPAVTVDVEDQFGNLVPTDDSNVTLALGSGGTLAGTVTVAAVNGVATFTGLIPETSGAQVLKATDGAITAATSAAFIVTPGTPTQIGFVTQPTATWLGTPTTVTVGVEDQFGNVIPVAPQQITLVVDSAPSGGSVRGSLTATTSNGLATFNLGLSTSGAYTFTATSETFGNASSNALTALEPPVQRFLFNGAAVRGVLLGAQEKTTAASLPPASDFVESANPGVSPAIKIQTDIAQSTSTSAAANLFSDVPVDNLISPDNTDLTDPAISVLD
jgi:hypothetical protein